MEKLIFLALSLVTGILELGVVWYGSTHSRNPLIALVFALAYQLGNLAFVKKGRMTTRAVGSAALGTAVLLSLAISSDDSTSRLIRECLVIFVSSLALQTARERLKSECPTGIKRIFRILGFIASPVMALVPYIVLLISLLFPTIILLIQGRAVGNKEKCDPKVIPTMVFHQMHYFVYTYVILWWFSDQAKLRGIDCNEWIIAGGFGITWLIYMMPEIVSRIRKENNYKLQFFIGHSLLLTIMIFSSIFAGLGLYVPLIALWSITGIGGGTVYAIPKLTCEYRMTDMKLSEDLGHVLGVLIAIGVYVIFGFTYGISIFLALSAIFVVITLAFARTDIRKERKNNERIC